MGSPAGNVDRVSGTLRHSGGAVEYSRAGIREWRLPLDQIAVIGEFTISSLGDDYFVLFVTPTGDSFRASFYAIGRDACLAALSEHLGAVLQLTLCDSTEFKSRVLWPLSLAGQPLLELVVARPVGRLARVAHHLGIGSTEAHLSEPVRIHLGLPVSTHAP
jgi:hypothetical protein